MCSMNAYGMSGEPSNKFLKFFYSSFIASLLVKQSYAELKGKLI